jgi:acyl carrier protein
MENRIKNILSIIFEIPKEDISNDSNPESIDKWDSLNHINMIVSIEKEFNIYFDDSEIEKLVSVDKIIEIVKLKMD